MQRWPRLSAVVLDIAPVCPVASEYAARHGLSDRITTHVADSWADPFPAADVHFYADIFHDWPDDKCRFLAEKSFRSLPRGGRLALHELLISDVAPLYAAAGNGPGFIAQSGFIALTSAAAPGRLGPDVTASPRSAAKP